MKKWISILLAALLMFTCCAIAQEAAEEQADIRWDTEDGILSVYVRTTASGANTWAASLSQEDMLLPVSEEYEAYVLTFDTMDVYGDWVTTWVPAPEAAGIVEIILSCHADGNDAPQTAYRLEIYLDGNGGVTVLTLNGEEIGELPVE